METGRGPRDDRPLPRSAADATDRRRRLARRRPEVERFRTRLASVQAALEGLRALEATRPLGAEARRRVVRVRLESEGRQLAGAAPRKAFECRRD
jgi:hypothetical protein